MQGPRAYRHERTGSLRAAARSPLQLGHIERIGPMVVLRMRRNRDPKSVAVEALASDLAIDC